MAPVKQKKPNCVLFDISGTAARESFVQKTLLPYFKSSYKTYLENNWNQPECRDAVQKLTDVSLSDDDVSAPKIDLSENKSTAIVQVSKYIEWCMEKGKESKAFSVFRFLVWFDGYDKGKLKTPVYSDVAVSIQRWKCIENIKLYILSNGWSEATKKFMSKTSHGDLNVMIDGHFDTSMGSLTTAETYKKVATKIGEKPDDICFLTKAPEEAKAAKKAGLNVILVLTHGPAVEAAQETCKDIPIARTFTDIEFVE